MPPRPTFSPLRLAVCYALLCGGWIVVSDTFLKAAGLSSEDWHLLAVGKGLLFTIVTSLLLYGWARWFQAIAVREKDAIAQACERTDHVRRMYATLSAVNRQIIRPLDRVVLSQAICDAMIDPGGFCGAWVARADLERTTLTRVASAGVEVPDELALDRQAPAGTDARCLLDCCTTGKPAICQRTAADDATLGRMRSACGARSAIAIPLHPDGVGVKTFVVYSDKPEFFTADIVAMLTEMASDLEYGFEVIAERERRTAAEMALRASEERYRLVAENSHDVIWIMSLDGQLQYISPSIERLLGYAPAKMLTMRFSAYLTPQATRIAEQELHAAIQELEATGHIHPRLMEIEQIRADGSTVWTEISTTDFHDRNGRVIALLGVTRDISERKHFEHRLLRAQRLESVGLIASGIAHDLNNVLTPILLSTGMLEMQFPSPEGRAILQPIEAAARRGSNIVQQILTFARGADGQRMCIEPKVLLKELAGLIRETFPRNIQLELSITPGTSPVSGDPTQLHQVFLNLALNARDAMPSGGQLSIEVANRTVSEDQARAMPAAHAGDHVCFTVSDTGTGMTAEVLDHLFEPFFTTKPRGRGTGLGLSTVHGLVKSHGGFIDVASESGAGSKFRVFLPAASPSGSRSSRALETTRSRIGNGEQILVIDDEPSILTVLGSVLERQGFLPVKATDGDEAMGILEKNCGRVRAVITDVMMPKYDGVRLAAELRRRWPSIPVIAMSGMISSPSDDDSRKQLRDLGVLAILDKPYGETELLNAIQTALSRRAGTSDEPGKN